MKKLAVLFGLIAAGAIFSEISSTRTFNAFIKENNLTKKYDEWAVDYIKRKSEESWSLRQNRW
jgi:hypothetical protein